MENNEVMIGIRYALHLKNAEVQELIQKGGGEITPLEVVDILRPEDDPQRVYCKPEWLHQFMDGLIEKQRGAREGGFPDYDRSKIDNNLILKKIRIAFSLKDTDVVSILKKTDFGVTKSELGAISRKPGHPKYMRCGDQFLRYLLRGLAQEFRPKNI